MWPRALSWHGRQEGTAKFAARKDVGTGTKEIRIRDSSGIFRVMYVAKFEEAVYVLHCFQKKAQATSKQDKDIAEVRYCAVVNARRIKR